MSSSFLQEAKEKMQKLFVFHERADQSVVDYVLSTTAAQFLQGLKSEISEPAWGYLVGPPGCGKSELLRPFEGWHRMLQVDAISPKALVSGKQREDDPSKNCSMLHLFNHKVLCMTDFTVQSKQAVNETEELFGLLRKAFDGSLSKLFGNDAGLQSAACDFGMLVCTTPGTANLMSVLNATLGERMFAYRICRRPVRDLAESMRQLDAIQARSTAKGKKREEIRLFLQAGLEEISQRGVASKAVDYDGFLSANPIQEKMRNLALLVSKLRIRPGVGYSAEPSIGGYDGNRIRLQLLKLGIARAVLDGRASLDETDYPFMARVAHDSLLPKVVALLATLYRAPFLSCDQITTRLGWIPGDLLTEMRQWVYSGLVETDGAAKSYRLSEGMNELLDRTEFLEPYLYVRVNTSFAEKKGVSA